MLIALFGPPGPTTRWGVHLVRTLIDQSLGQYDFLAADTVEQLRALWQERKAAHAVLVSEGCEAALAETFIRSNSPIVVFADDPADVIAFVAVDRNLAPASAIRATSKSMAALHDLFLRTDTLIVQRPQRPTSLRKAIEQIAEFLHIPASATAIEAVMAQIAPNRRPDGDCDMREAIDMRASAQAQIAEWRKSLSAPDQALIESIAEPLRNQIKGEPVWTLTWPRSLFACSDVENPPDAEVSLLGPARTIFFGPYLHLPRGDWTASFIFSVKDAEAFNELSVDIFSNMQDILAKAPIELAGEGYFRADLPFTVSEPGFPLEARVMLARGAIEGRLGLEKIDITRVALGPVNLEDKEQVS